MSIYDSAYRKFLSELRTARLAAGLSQEELADRLGKHQTFVSKVEKGQRYLDVLEFVRWSAAIQADPASLMTGLSNDVIGRRARRRLTE